MKKLKPFIPSVIAIFAGILVSFYLVQGFLIDLFVYFIAPLIILAILAIRSICAKPPRWRPFLSTLAPCILLIGIVWSYIPLRLAFRFYRSEFDEVASQIETGNPPATPFWIGPFRIRMAGRRGDSGTPYVCANRDKGEIKGFVKHPEGHGFNIWSCITLDEAWSYIAED